MTNYKFTVTLTTDFEEEIYRTDDLSAAYSRFADYQDNCEENLIGDYEIVLINNETGEVYKRIEYYLRNDEEEDSEKENTIENLFAKKLLEEIKQACEEMSTDDFAKLT